MSPRRLKLSVCRKRRFVCTGRSSQASDEQNHRLMKFLQ